MLLAISTTLLLNFLITVIIAGALLGFIWYLLSLLPLPEPVSKFIRLAFIVVFIIIMLIFLIRLFNGEGFYTFIH